ncbi:MAG: hypothetical protein IPK85_00580 [Gemmatimonadetes bacterium]|nr:hypothetical protein [Gemmatimonadota bacterium]
MKVRHRARVSVISLVLACSGGGTVVTPPPPPPSIVSVSISPGNVVLTGPGATSALSAQVVTTAGIVANPTPGIATVVGSGTAATVTSVAPGTTTVRATSGGVTGTTAVLVQPAASLAIVASPLSVAQGTSGTTTAVVTRTSFTGPLAVTIDPLPAGITAAVSPGPITSGNIETHTLTLTVVSAMTTGTYPVTVRASGSGVTAVSFTFNLVVINGAAPTTTFHGTWTGTGVQTSPNITWNVLLTYAGGPIGSVVATVAYPSLTCGGTWTLRSQGADSLRVRETITFGNCFDSDYTVRITPNGQLDFRGTAVAFPIAIAGTLTRASAPTGPSLGAFATMWRGLRLPYNNTAEHNFDLGLVDGPVGAIVGSSAYPSLSCGGPVRLTRVTATEIDVVEQVTYGSCTSGDTLTISRNSTPASGMMVRWRRERVTKHGRHQRLLGGASRRRRPIPESRPPPSRPVRLSCPGPTGATRRRASLSSVRAEPALSSPPASSWRTPGPSSTKGQPPAPGTPTGFAR